MSKINLLPWREEMRKGLNKIFFFFLGGSVILSVIIVALFDMYLGYKIGVANANIAYVNKEMKNATVGAAEVKKLQADKARLLEHINIIKLLEIDRTSIVRLLDMIPHVLPESVYLTALSRTEEIKEQTGQNLPVESGPPLPPNLINVQSKNEKEAGKEQAENFQKKYSILMEGVAVTNGSISILLKNLEKITWISDVNLSEVSVNENGEGLDFKLGFTQILKEGE